MPSIKIEVKTLDKGLAKLQKRIATLSQSDSFVKAGVLGTKAKENRDGLTTAQLAAVHEFGTRDGRIPERPFLRGTFRRNREAYRGFLTVITRDGVIAGKISLREALGQLGLKMQADIRNTIQQSIGLAPNAPSTYARKLAKSYAGAAPGDPRPLIDTGRLLGAVTFEVVMGPKDTASGKAWIIGGGGT